MSEWPWIRNCWQVAGTPNEVVAGELLARTIMEEPLLLFRDAANRIAIVEDRCPHRIYPLSRGRYIDAVVECGYHGMRFDATGACVAIPGQASIPEKARIRAYPVCERYGWVWVWMGDATLADPELVPSLYRWTEETGWRTLYLYEHFACNYQLLVDNLLDLSHETFVHAEFIGTSAITESTAKAAIVDDRRVHIHRFMPNCEAPPFSRAVGGFTARIDRRQASWYEAPSYVLVESSATPVGKDTSFAIERRNMFPLTPETRSSTHMFWAVARNNRLDDVELDRFISEKAAEVQLQDKAVVEAQQTLIGERPDVDFPIAIRVDAGVTLGRRLHERALARDPHHGPAPGMTGGAVIHV